MPEPLKLENLTLAYAKQLLENCCQGVCEQERANLIHDLGQLVRAPGRSCAEKAQVLELMGRLARRKSSESPCQNGVALMVERFRSARSKGLSVRPLWACRSFGGFIYRAVRAAGPALGADRPLALLCLQLLLACMPAWGGIT